MAMAVQRADHIAAAMQVQERGVAVGVGGRGPFGAHATSGHRLDHDIAGQPVGEAARVDVLAPLVVIIRPRTARQFRPQCDDFRIAHLFGSSLRRVAESRPHTFSFSVFSRAA
jgi:hypothetical protein